MDCGRNLLAATDGSRVYFWNDILGETTVFHEAIVRSHSRLQTMDFSCDGSILASCPKSNNFFYLTSIGKSSVTATVENITKSCNTVVSFSNTTSRYLGLGTDNNGAIIYDLKKKMPKLEFSNLGGTTKHEAIKDLQFSFNDSHIASGNSSGNITIHNCINRARSCVFSPLENTSIEKLRYGILKKDILVSGHDTGAVMFSDVNTSRTICSYVDAHFSPVISLLSTSKFTSMISVGLDKKIVFFDERSQNMVNHHKLSHLPISSDLSPCGRILAIGTVNGKIKLYDLHNFSKPVKKISIHSNSKILNLKFQKFQWDCLKKACFSQEENRTPLKAGPDELSEKGTSSSNSSDYEDVFSPLSLNLSPVRSKNLKSKSESVTSMSNATADQDILSPLYSPYLQHLEVNFKKPSNGSWFKTPCASIKDDDVDEKIQDIPSFQVTSPLSTPYVSMLEELPECKISKNFEDLEHHAGNVDPQTFFNDLKNQLENLAVVDKTSEGQHNSDSDYEVDSREALDETSNKQHNFDANCKHPEVSSHFEAKNMQNRASRIEAIAEENTASLLNRPDEIQTSCIQKMVEFEASFAADKSRLQTMGVICRLACVTEKNRSDLQEQINQLRSEMKQEIDALKEQNEMLKIQNHILKQAANRNSY